MTANAGTATSGIVGPDETESNRLGAVLEVTGKAGRPSRPVDEHLDRHGRVMEILSEHTCQGWLEGYLLTGRHGLFSCYEAFIHIVDSMFNQHAKWLKVTRRPRLARPVASLNYLLTSHVWRQDHNGFSHQDPGFIDHVVNKKAEVVRVYLPPDANTLLSVADHCLRSRDYVNVIVAGKQPAPTWLDMDAAALHCARGAGHLGLGQQRRRRPRRGPRLRRRRAHPGDARRHRPAAPHLPDLQGPGRQRGRPDAPAARRRTPARPARRRVRRASSPPTGRSIFAYHGYPWLIHRLTYRRTGHAQHPRPRVQGGGHHDHPVRHARHERHGPLPPGHGRHRPGPRARPAGPPSCASRWSTSAPSTAPTSARTGEDLPEVRDWTWPRTPMITPALPDGGRPWRR